MPQCLLIYCGDAAILESEDYVTCIAYVDCGDAVVHIAMAQCANLVRRASLKNGAMGGLLCDPVCVCVCERGRRIGLSFNVVSNFARRGNQRF